MWHRDEANRRLDSPYLRLFGLLLGRGIVEEALGLGHGRWRACGRSGGWPAVRWWSRGNSEEEEWPWRDSVLLVSEHLARGLCRIAGLDREPVMATGA